MPTLPGVHHFALSVKEIKCVHSRGTQIQMQSILGVVGVCNVLTSLLCLDALPSCSMCL